MKIKKSLFILLFCLVFSAWAKNNNSLYVIQTKWFEIIYPQKCKMSAQILYENADKIYEDVTNQYGLQPSFKIPIVLTPAVDSFNAFWTSAPYNHIVIYDTSVSLKSELAVFSETLLNTFKHELTHAVTYNMKNPFWIAFSNIFGDCITPSSLWISPGMAEGAALTSESSDGEGRLNDEFAKHPVKQAKIEQQFPGYYDVTGASDKYPAGAYYWFNGAFHQWLQENFGLQKYAEFWNQLVNLKSLTVGIAFKKVYEIELKNAWENFINDYKVPNIPANPLETGFVQDFFISRNGFYSLENRIGSHFTSLTNSKKAIAWIDTYGGKIKYVSVPDPQIQKISLNNAKTLFQLKNVQTISLSQDNRFMAVSYFSENSKGTTAKTKIYDFKTNRFYKIKTNGLKESAIIQANGKYYLVAKKFESPKNTLYIEEIQTDSKNRIFSTEFFAQKDFPLNVNISNFVQTENGKFAFLKKEKSEYSIVVCSLNEKNIAADFTEYKMPLQKTVVRSLSYNYDGKFYFSWAVPNTMPRLGMLDIFENKFLLTGEKGDFSGGIFEPVAFGTEIAYTAQFYKFSRMLKIPDCDNFFNSVDSVAYNCIPATFYSEDFETEKSAKKVSENPEIKNSFLKYDESDDFFLEDDTLFSKNLNSESKNQITENEGSNKNIKSYNFDYFQPKKYNPFKYILGGIFLPFTDYEPDYFAFNAYETPYNAYLLGATFITASPWTNGTNSLYKATFGYDFFNKSFGVSLMGQNGTFSNLFVTNYSIKSEFNQNGWKNSGATIFARLNFDIGNESKISFANQLSGNIGFQDDLSERKFFNLNYYNKYLPPDETICYTFSEIFNATFSNVNKAGPGRYEKKGFSYTLGFGYRYDSDFSENPKEYVNAFQILQKFRFYIPRMFPFYPKFGITANFPAIFEFSLFPIEPQYLSYSYYANFGKSVFDFNAEIILFAAEIQRAIPFLHAVFFNDLCISAGYVSSLATGKNLDYSNFYDYANILNYAKLIFNGNTAILNSVFLKINLSLTPNMGGLTSSSAKSDFYIKAYYSLRKKFFYKNETGIPVKIEFGFSSLF